MEEGFVVCSKCGGKGTLDVNEDPIFRVSRCPKCLGVGKLDWVENVVGKTPWGSKISRSCLDDVNVRKLTQYISKTIEKQLMISNTLILRDSDVNSIRSFLDELQGKRAFYDYNIHWERDNNFIDVYIKPNHTVEFVCVSFTIT